MSANAIRPRQPLAAFAVALSLALLGGCNSLCPMVAPTCGGLARASSAQPDPLPEAQPPSGRLLPPEPIAPKELPLGLDTVLRLADDKNGQLQVARVKLEEARAGVDLARYAWLPQVQVGAAYYRHEGGIQDFQGNLVRSSYGSLFGGLEVRGRLDPRDVAFQRVDAERKLWQQKGELSKLTSEHLLDAASTYIDFLAARAGEGSAIRTEKHLTDLLEQASALAKVDPGVRVEVERVEGEIRAHRLVLRKFREGADLAAAKLTYLLGVDPDCQVVPIETHLTALSFVDADQPVQALVEQALVNGPGIRELEGLLQVIDQARAAAEGPGKWLPAVEVVANEGAFGAGSGSRLSWDNQFNLGMCLRWNLTDALTAKERLRQADLKAAQAHLSYQDLRSRLALGVREARESIVSNLDQLRMADEQVRYAEKSYELSASRLKENIKGRSPSEVLAAIRALNGARLQYIQSLRELDKAEIRLMLLVGGSRVEAPCEPH